MRIRAVLKITMRAHGYEEFMSLLNLAKIYGTDKCDVHHTFSELNYIDIYEKHFEKLRLEPLNLLEIGVLNGSSLRMWKEYFPNAKIFGLDIDPSCASVQEDRIDITIGSQDDENTLLQLSNKAGYFDIVIDDGSHVNKMILTSYRFLWQHLKSKGWYVIEDMGCSFMNASESWPGMIYNKNKDFSNNRTDIDTWIISHLHDMDCHQGNVLSMQFWPYMVFMQKI